MRVEEDRLIIGYEALFRDYGFVKPEVMVEFGARATGEPREVHLIQCDAAPHLTEVDFPSARPHVMLAERTFWEKATAAHVYLSPATGTRRTPLPALARLGSAGQKLEYRCSERWLTVTLAVSVARHKTMFFRENDANGNAIDYVDAVSGDLQLVPDGEVRRVLSEDYARMVDGGMLPADAEEFDELMDRCADIQERANG